MKSADILYTIFLFFAIPLCIIIGALFAHSILVLFLFGWNLL